MTVSTALSIATSGLAAADARARVAAGNIANAQTPGYARRDAVLEQRTVGGEGAGVGLSGISRAEARFLTTERMALDAQSADASERADGAAAISRIFGRPEDADGLMAAYARFETALRDAASTPESAVLLNGLAEAGSALALRLNEASADAASLRSAADREIGVVVEDVNAALTRLEELNALGPSQVTPEVADERQRLIDRINEQIPVKVYEDGHKINLTTEGGAFLLTDRAQPLAFTPAGTVGRSQTLGAPLSGLTAGGVDITPTGGGPQRSTGGRIAALFSARDETVPAFQDDLDAMATALVTSFSDDAVDPTKPAGEAGLFVDGASTSQAGDGLGIAGRIRLSPQVDGAAYRLRDGLGAAAPGPAGNGEQLSRLIGAFEGGRLVEGAAETASSVGALDQASGQRAAAAAGRRVAAADAELSVTGVDTDRELQQLLMIEQAYAANARVIQTVDRMLDALMAAV
jgi:flagellar hook-associated protein 1 FlgK